MQAIGFNVNYKTIISDFASDECKCIRYSISLDENDSIIRKTVGLEVKYVLIWTYNLFSRNRQ